MSNSLQTIGDCVKLYEASRDRVSELEKAVAAFGEENGSLASLQCSITVRQGLAWEISVPASRDFARQFIETELIRETDKLARMQRKLDAAVGALQQQS